MKIVVGAHPQPFIGTVEAKVCHCDHAPKELFTAKTQESAVRRIAPYWDVYLQFYGDQIVWLNFDIIDTRDGVIVWRNGHPMKEETHGGEAEDGTRGVGRKGNADTGRWLVGERRLEW